jgi:hypothetical protein
MISANVNAKTLIDTDFGIATHEVNVISQLPPHKCGGL